MISNYSLSPHTWIEAFTQHTLIKRTQQRPRTRTTDWICVLLHGLLCLITHKHNRTNITNKQN